MTRTANFIVTRDTNGEDRVWAGVKDGRHTWTLIPEKMKSLSAGLELELLRDFRGHDHGDGARVVVGHSTLGPVVRLDDEHRAVVLGWNP